MEEQPPIWRVAVNVLNKRCVQGFGGKPKGKRPLGRPRCRGEINIKMDLQDVGCGGMDWIGLAQVIERWQAVVNVVMNLQFL
jgi:hypothetical protein